ncbi:hypothetical protein HOY80DRAFT_965794 [Tuber brumale]|nr:hypothetical protein HOY80DRAFT_965794 [Tuber brumale]
MPVSTTPNRLTIMSCYFFFYSFPFLPLAFFPPHRIAFDYSYTFLFFFFFPFSSNVCGMVSQSTMS